MSIQIQDQAAELRALVQGDDQDEQRDIAPRANEVAYRRFADELASSGRLRPNVVAVLSARREAEKPPNSNQLSREIVDGLKRRGGRVHYASFGEAVPTNAWTETAHGGSPRTALLSEEPWNTLVVDLSDSATQVARRDEMGLHVVDGRQHSLAQRVLPVTTHLIAVTSPDALVVLDTYAALKATRHRAPFAARYIAVECDNLLTAWKTFQRLEESCQQFLQLGIHFFGAIEHNQSESENY